MYSYISVVSPQDSITISPAGNVLAGFNSAVTLSCSAQGGPNNMVVWRRQGTVISSGDSELELLMITSSDAGVYQCTVTNDAGSDDNTVLLTGMYFPYEKARS